MQCQNSISVTPINGCLPSVPFVFGGECQILITVNYSDTFTKELTAGTIVQLNGDSLLAQLSYPAVTVGDNYVIYSSDGIEMSSSFGTTQVNLALNFNLSVYYSYRDYKFLKKLINSFIDFFIISFTLSLRYN